MDNIINDFCKAWQTLDASLIIQHLDESFVYDSQWVFSSLDYSGYVDYIQGKFNNIKNTGNSVVACVVDDTCLGGKMLKLGQGNSVCYYRIKVREGKVVKGDLCAF
mgnify:FL=1